MDREAPDTPLWDELRAEVAGDDPVPDHVIADAYAALQRRGGPPPADPPPTDRTGRP